MMPTFAFALSNGREVQVSGPDRDACEAAALERYPEAVITGVLGFWADVEATEPEPEPEPIEEEGAEE